MMPTPRIPFLVDDTLAGFFTEVSGIGSENELIEHKVVNANGQEMVRLLPGRLKWSNVSLKRGVTSSTDVWEWRELVVQGKMEDARKNASITAFDREGNAVGKWHFTNAWPSKADGPSFKSDDNSIALESVEIVHEGMYRET
jgi:phage tail-like protein